MAALMGATSGSTFGLPYTAAQRIGFEVVGPSLVKKIQAGEMDVPTALAEARSYVYPDKDMVRDATGEIISQFREIGDILPDFQNANNQILQNNPQGGTPSLGNINIDFPDFDLPNFSALMNTFIAHAEEQHGPPQAGDIIINVPGVAQGVTFEQTDTPTVDGSSFGPVNVIDPDEPVSIQEVNSSGGLLTTQTTGGHVRQKLQLKENLALGADPGLVTKLAPRDWAKVYNKKKGFQKEAYKRYTSFKRLGYGDIDKAKKDLTKHTKALESMLNHIHPQYGNMFRYTHDRGMLVS